MFKKRDIKIKIILKHCLILTVVLFFTKFTLRDTLSFADILPFAGNSEVRITHISYIWSERFLGYNSFTSIINIISSFFELISFGNILIAQFLFWSFFYTVSYYGFVAVLKTLKINTVIAFFIGFVWVFNPDTLPDSTFELIIYSLLPITFLLIYRNLRRPTVYLSAILSILIGVQMFNMQMFFWTYSWIGILVLIMLIKKRTTWRNIILTALMIIPALMINPFAVSDLLGYTRSASANSIDYQKGFDDCYHTVNTNLLRLSGNSCSYPAHKLRIFENTPINNIGYIFPGVIGLYLWKEHWLKKSWKKDGERQHIVYFSVITIGIIILTILTIRLDIIDFLIAQKNVFILSIRNQTKFIPISTFSVTILLALAVDWLLLRYSKIQKLSKKISARVLQLSISTILISSWVIYNRDWIIHPNTNTLNTKNKELLNKQKELRTFLKDTEDQEFSIYLPNNRPISLTNRWNKNIVSNTVGNIMKDTMEYDLQYSLYKKICKNEIENFANYDINIKYAIIDKTAKVESVKNEWSVSSDDGECNTTQFYGAPIISTTKEFLNKTFKHFPVVFETSNFVIYKLNNNEGRQTIELLNNNNSLECEKVNQTKYNIQLSEVQSKVEIVFRQSFDKNWGIYTTGDNNKRGVKLHTIHTIHSNVLNKFEINIKDVDSQWYTKKENGAYDLDLQLFYEPQKQYQNNVIISTTTSITLLSIIIYSTLTKRNN